MVRKNKGKKKKGGGGRTTAPKLNDDSSLIRIRNVWPELDKDGCWTCTNCRFVNSSQFSWSVIAQNLADVLHNAGWVHRINLRLRSTWKLGVVQDAYYTYQDTIDKDVSIDTIDNQFQQLHRLIKVRSLIYEEDSGSDEPERLVLAVRMITDCQNEEYMKEIAKSIEFHTLVDCIKHYHNQKSKAVSSISSENNNNEDSRITDDKKMESSNMEENTDQTVIQSPQSDQADIDTRLMNQYITPLLNEIKEVVVKWSSQSISSGAELLLVKDKLESDDITSNPRSVIQAQLQCAQVANDHPLSPHFGMLREFVNVRSILKRDGVEMAAAKLEEVSHKQHMIKFREAPLFRSLLRDMKGLVAADAKDDKPAPTDEDSILKVLLSSDNHLGYLEHDPIRGMDSFAAFEEVLCLARQNKVDLVLLSGDLFHDSIPSQKTLEMTTEILRRYCIGTEAVKFQIVDDQKDEKLKPARKLLPNEFPIEMHDGKDLDPSTPGDMNRIYTPDGHFPAEGGDATTPVTKGDQYQERIPIPVDGNFYLCAICGLEVDERICCKICPRSYHKKCLERAQLASSAISDRASETSEKKMACKCKRCEDDPQVHPDEDINVGVNIPNDEKEKIQNAYKKYNEEGSFPFNIMILCELLQILSKLSEYDYGELFIAPVDTNMITDYLKTIRTPMDYGTIISKLEKGEYAPSSEEKDGEMDAMEEIVLYALKDILQVYHNCLMYNPKGGMYYRAGEVQARKWNAYYSKHIVDRVSPSVLASLEKFEESCEIERQSIFRPRQFYATKTGLSDSVSAQAIAVFDPDTKKIVKMYTSKASAMSACLLLHNSGYESGWELTNSNAKSRIDSAKDPEKTLFGYQWIPIDELKGGDFTLKKKPFFCNEGGGGGVKPMLSKDVVILKDDTLTKKVQGFVSQEEAFADWSMEMKGSLNIDDSLSDFIKQYLDGDKTVNGISYRRVESEKKKEEQTETEESSGKVDLPIFTIYNGNHNDLTTRETVFDILSATNHVKCFGHGDDGKVDNIEVNPVLLQKGDTKVALYGIGSMCDERLKQMWLNKKVRFARPEHGSINDDEEKEWFNIFTLHQKHDLGHEFKNCIHEASIPAWIDMVVWGHEHESCIGPVESLVGTFRITHPGSTIATSLTAGESKTKHVGLLEVKGSNFRLRGIPLRSVRSFSFGEVNLCEKAKEGVLDTKDPEVEEQLSEVLAAEVDTLIERARQQADDLAQYAEEKAIELHLDEPKQKRNYHIKQPEKVLVQLNVDNDGFPALDKQKFGSMFVDKVANDPSDILSFQISWQSDDDKHHRREMIQNIAKLLTEWDPKNWQLKDKGIQQLENSLYISAPSLEAYLDMTTLRTRLYQLAMEIAKKTQQAKEGSTGEQVDTMSSTKPAPQCQEITTGSVNKIRIAITTDTSESATFSASLSDTVQSLKDQAHRKWGILPSLQRLSYQTKPDLKNECTLCDYNIQNGDRLQLFKRAAPKLEQQIQIIIKVVKGIVESETTISIDPSDSIHSVKAKVYEMFGIPIPWQHLIFALAKLTNDDRTLSSYNIKDGSTLYLVQNRSLRKSNPNMISIKVTSFNDSDVAKATVIEEIDPFDRIRYIKTKINEAWGYSIDAQRLMFGSVELEDGCTVSDYRIKEGDEVVVEGQVGILFKDEDVENDQLVTANLGSDIGGVLRQYCDNNCINLSHYQFSYMSKVIKNNWNDAVGSTLLRFTYNEKLLDPSRRIIPHELDMKSRGDYIITVSRLTDEEVKAQNCIARFMLSCHIKKQVKVILARNVIADFAWRCNEKEKAREVISAFIWKYHQHRKAQRLIGNLIWSKIALQRRRRSRGSAISIQKVVRGVIARGIYLESLQPKLDAVRHFYNVWKKTIEQVPCSVPSLTGWGLVRERLDLKRVDLLDEDGNLADTDEKLNQALSVALIEENESEEIEDEEVEEALSHLTIEEDRVNMQEDVQAKTNWSQFQVTSHVVKFMKNGDVKYKEMFVKKMKQLAKGERSHKLQKPLKGCESIIYESYLENKGGGFRILWTEEGDRIVVWFIAKHKSVSRLAKLIDDAKHRTARQQMPQNLVDELNADSSTSKTTAKREVLLDALGNVPLKLYDVNFDNIDDIATSSWTPQMSLTDEERKVVEAKGTVLLLGRSGTGKTICICNRIEYDRQRLGDKPKFSQLFVSRSSRLCRYVEKAVGSSPQSNFYTFDNLLHELDVSLSEEEVELNDNTRHFHPRQRVSFAQFKQFYDEHYAQNKIAALIVWKSIRTFIKGSIEAYQSSSKVLSREHFVSEKLGKNRCKIPLDLRDSIYDIFVQYQAWLLEQQMWDDCDRIQSLLRQIDEAKKTSSVVCEKIKWSKVYVDEVQDYTQIEILLFFSISGVGSLFLAGDPAQSVEQGTDFRFEEVRAVGYYVAGNRQHLIPDKPKIVNINFRSHAGILNCAGGFLDLLFEYFPGSAKQLKKDYGLFKGARPGVFHQVQVDQLSSLLKTSLQGCVILTHDESASHWRDELNHPLVYGIREAKGLEFKSCIILNFFSDIPLSLQKPWRNLLKNREGSDFELKYPLVETHLKLIYTATTRCIEQLFFAETCSSIAGDAATRWLTSTKPSDDDTTLNTEAIATHNNVSDLDSMIMTNDEWCIAGIDNAELASSPDIDMEQSISYLNRAIYCLDKAQSSELVAKANAHLQSIILRSKTITQDVSSSPDKLEAMEREVAQLTQSLLKEDLLSECTKLLDYINPYLSTYTKEMLGEKIITKIQT